MINTFEELLSLTERHREYNDQGHWLSTSPLSRDGLYGFLYAVENTNNGSWYLGKKAYSIGGKKTRMVKGKRVKNTRHGADSGWRDYSTSSEHIKLAITEHGKRTFNFYHLWDYETKGGLSFAEPRILHKLDCLVALKEDGTRRFYNNNISGVRFIPKEF